MTNWITAVVLWTVMSAAVAFTSSVATTRRRANVHASSFRSSSSINNNRACFMVPVYDKTTAQWSPTTDDDLPSAGYDILGTLLRQGPNPALQRIFKPTEYEQAVLKFMAGDKCDRNTAQGNMDAYLRNPSDWAYSRMRGYEIDYATINSKDIVLVSAWSAFVLAALARGAYSLSAHENFWAFLKASISA